MLSIEAFHSQHSLYEMCIDAASGRTRDGIRPFVRALNDDAALTFSRQGPCLLTLPSDVQSRVLMFLSWLCCKGLIEDSLTDLAALASRLTESVRDKDVSIPPLCRAIIVALSSQPLVRKALCTAASTAAPRTLCCNGNNAASCCDDQESSHCTGTSYLWPHADGTPVNDLRTSDTNGCHAGAEPLQGLIATDGAPALQAASTWIRSSCSGSVPAEAGSELSEAFYRNPQSVVELFRSCGDATVLNLVCS